MDYHLSEEIRCILDDQTPPKLIGDEAIVDAPPPKLISGGEAIVDTPIGGLVGTQLSVGNEEMPGPQLSDVDEGRRSRRGRRSGTDQRPPWLPEGWHIMTRKRQNGRTAGHVDKYYVRPDGRRFRSKREVEDCIRRTIANPIQGQQ